MTEMTSYQLNHPKAYIGYTIARAVGDSKADADRLTEDYVVGGVNMARRGAKNLELITDSCELTAHGEWLCDIAPDVFEAESLMGVLETFHGLRGARSRFVDEFPAFKENAPFVARGDPVIDRFVTLLNDAHVARERHGRLGPLTTSDLFSALWRRDPLFAGELLIRKNDHIRETVLGSTDPSAWADINPDALDLSALQTNRSVDGEIVYRSAVTYQLKTILYHLGVLEESGVQAKYLVPSTLTWQLDTQVDVDATIVESEAHA